MAELKTIARPYAVAAFEEARQAGQMEAWSTQLHLLAQAAADSQLSALFGSPQISRDSLFAIFSGVLGDKPLAAVQRLLRLVLDNRRETLLPEIAVLFDELKSAAEGQLDATIESAFPLADGQIEELVAALETRFGRRVKAEVRVVASLLGGVRIAIGDDVIDSSVQGKLQAMANQLKS